MPAIHEKMCLILRDCEAITKGRTNQSQGFKFRGIDDVYNSLHDIFAKHGVFILTEVTNVERGETQTRNGGMLFKVYATCKFTFCAADGSSVACTLVGEAMDSGDKGTNKAMSIALKYALFQTLLIPTEADNDPDAHTHEAAKHNGKEPPKETRLKGSETPVQKALADLRRCFTAGIKSKHFENSDAVAAFLFADPVARNAGIRNWDQLGKCENIDVIEALHAVLTDELQGARA